MRLERQNARGDAVLSRIIERHGNHRLMPAVHAIKIAERQHAALRNGGSGLLVLGMVNRLIHADYN